ncbi:MAG: alanine--glyoxylate aminotransferase family protein [Planctomycetes bacterium]|nr:alanine--glyoxylate aminotransferase family protein [Planctomycetota bacterium]
MSFPGEFPPRMWIPGPTYVRPEILAALARPTVGHRTTIMTELVKSIAPRLQRLFRTKQHSLTITASGSAAWEGAVRCGVVKRWACITNGSFSEGWARTGESSGRDTVKIAFEWGEGLDPQRIEEQLRRAGPVEAVGFVSNETSTGAYSDVPAICAAVRRAQPDALLFVDAVSTLAGAPFEFDEWDIDVALASSQKCLALPPGIAVVALSDRFLDKARTVAGRGYYLDFVHLADDWDRLHQTPTTPAVNMFYALDEQLAAMEREGYEARFARHRAMRDRVDAWANGHGFPCFVAEKYRSPTTANRATKGFDIATFLARMIARGHELSNGYGKLKGHAFRIGHFGDHSMAELDHMLAIADEVLHGMGR